MKSNIIAIFLFACSIACGQDQLIAGIQTEISKGVSVSISLEGKLTGAETSGDVALSYGVTGRLEKIGDARITYGLTGRPESIGGIRIICGLTGRPESIGGVRLTYGLTGRLERIGDARISYGLTGGLERVVGELPTGCRLQLAFP